MEDVKELDFLIDLALNDWDNSMELFKTGQGPEPDTMVRTIAKTIESSDWLATVREDAATSAKFKFAFWRK